MPREFKPELGAWGRFAPPTWQAAMSVPTPMARDMRGRIELVIGRLGAGKTTWGSLRARRLALATDRTLVTNGIGWPEPWVCVGSFDQMEALRDCVFVWDELHLMLPSSKGLLGREHERFLIRWLSLARKRGICVVGTTQAWTRCATHYRQLVTTVWVADAVNRGRLHVARGFDPPEDGGRQSCSAQWFGPAAARIPTHATVWSGYSFDELEGLTGAGGAKLSALDGGGAMSLDLPGSSKSGAAGGRLVALSATRRSSPFRKMETPNASTQGCNPDALGVLADDISAGN